MGSFWEKIGLTIARKAIDALFKKATEKELPKKETPPPAKNENTKSDPKKPSHCWRLCPPGEHWVVTHPLTVPPSEKNPAGSVTTRRGHCAANPSGIPTDRDCIYADELKEIARLHKNEATPKPTPDSLGFPQGNAYDAEIALWTQFWNETLKPDEPLDPNLVKALIASESGFKPSTKTYNPPPAGDAYGLMQVTDQSRQIMQDEKSGEIRNQFIVADANELMDPTVNIAAGTRWFFHKRHLLSSRKGKPATWEETALRYKGRFQGKGKEAQTEEAIIMKHYRRLQKAKTK